MSTLYENIRFHCDKAGITGAKLCADAGISKSTLTSLKNGRTKKISTDNLARIAQRLGVSVDDLLGTETKKEPTAESGELSVEAREIARAFDAAGDELKSRIKDTTFGRNNAYAAIAKIEMVCPLGYGKQTIYQRVYCVSGKTFPEAKNNGCENYHSCAECEKCRADAILRAFEWDPLDCDRT